MGHAHCIRIQQIKYRNDMSIYIHYTGACTGKLVQHVHWLLHVMTKSNSFTYLWETIQGDSLLHGCFHQPNVTFPGTATMKIAQMYSLLEISLERVNHKTCMITSLTYVGLWTYP